MFIIKLDWSVCTCLTQLYDGRDMYRIYYIKNNYMFRPFKLASILEYSCLPSFFISQPDDGQFKGSKHVVVLYVINSMIVFFINLMHKFFILIHLLYSSTCFEHYCAHLEQDNYINTASGIVTLFG